MKFCMGIKEHCIYHYFLMAILGQIGQHNRGVFQDIIQNMKHLALSINFNLFLILSRASGMGSPTNHLGSEQRQETGPGILWSVNRWTGPKDPWPCVLSLTGAWVVFWRPHRAGTWQYFIFSYYLGPPIEGQGTILGLYMFINVSDGRFWTNWAVVDRTFAWKVWSVPMGRIGIFNIMFMLSSYSLFNVLKRTVILIFVASHVVQTGTRTPYSRQLDNRLHHFIQPNSGRITPDS